VALAGTVTVAPPLASTRPALVSPLIPPPSVYEFTLQVMTTLPMLAVCVVPVLLAGEQVSPVGLLITVTA
jgi:hypothetical protein